MGNKIPSPFPTYEQAQSCLTQGDFNQIKKDFKSLSSGTDYLTPKGFQKIPIKFSSYFRQHIMPRLFQVIDTKKDGLIDLEEFVCATTLFRTGKLEDRVKVLFLMYEPSKSGSLPKDHFRQLLIDSNIPCVSRGNASFLSYSFFSESLEDYPSSSISQNPPSSKDFKGRVGEGLLEGEREGEGEVAYMLKERIEVTKHSLSPRLTQFQSQIHPPFLSSLQALEGLSEGLVEAALYQFSSAPLLQEGRINLPDLCSLVKVDSSVQSLLACVTSILLNH